MTTDTIKLNNLIPVCMNFTFTEGHWDTKKPKLVQSFCAEVKWHEVAISFMMLNNVHEMNAKKSWKYDKYGSLQHLFCLLGTVAHWSTFFSGPEQSLHYSDIILTVTKPLFFYLSHRTLSQIYTKMEGDYLYGWIKNGHIHQKNFTEKW